MPTASVRIMKWSSDPKRTVRAAVMALTVVALLSAPSAAAAKTLVADGKHFRFKPRALAPANHSYFQGMRWSRWTPGKAVGRGTGHTQYPGGDPIDGSVKLTLSQPQRLCGRTLFTKATWKYKGRSATTTSFFQPFDDDSASCGYWTGA